MTSLATLAAMQAAGWPQADFMAGHSLGELSALAAAGSLTFADGLRLVRRRGELMKRAGETSPGGMAAILALETAVVRQICAEATERSGRPVQLVNDNCPGQLVISGDVEALSDAMALALEPQMLLLDEPMAGMGKDESQRMIALLDSLRGEKSMLLIEHDMDAVFALADRISVLVDGHIIATGSDREIRENPEVQRAFLGDGH